MFSKNTRQLSEHLREENAATHTSQAGLPGAFKSREETVQIVTGEDKVLQKYAHHLDVRSFPRSTFKNTKDEGEKHANAISRPNHPQRKTGSLYQTKFAR